MQKLLNTYFFVPCSQLWQRIFPNTTVGLITITALLLLGLAQPAAATEFYKDFVILNNNYYYTKNSSYGLKFQDNHITGPAVNGSFDRGTGQLLLGGEANTISTNGDDVYTPQMYYKVYPIGTAREVSDKLPFTPLTLGFQSSGNDGLPNSKKWSNTSTNSNLLAATSGPGRYVLEVYFSAYVTYNNQGGNGNFNIFDSLSGTINYTATFDVSGSVPKTWNGTQGNDWFDNRNWTPNGIPNASTDVTVPFIAGSTNYPTVYYGSKGPATVRTLSLASKITTNADGSTTPDVGGQIFLKDGELEIYGNFRDPNAGFRQTGGTLTFAGSTQDIDGGTFSTVRIKGGGKKNLSRRMGITTKLEFLNEGGVIVTQTDNTTDYNVDLESGARIIGETESSYVLGILRGRSQGLAQNVPATFGDIGVELNATSSYVGTIIATRRTGTAYTGTGVKNASITRSFRFNDNLNGANFDLKFHYLNTELNGMSANNFVLYRSVTGSAPFENLGSNNSASNTVTRQGITGDLAATFTVGEGVNPLPVTLVNFTAIPTAQGAALLRWTTATETNNKGFGIERQLAHGDTWQPVGYLASGNNATGGTYEYTDKSLTNAASTPQAYYRLRQEDQDGTVSYSPVAVVARQAAVASTELLLSPVPVTGSNISLTFAEASQAGSEISIINTQGQRLYSQTTQASGNAALSLPVEHLAAGVYIVSVRVPGQAVRHARFVKL